MSATSRKTAPPFPEAAFFLAYALDPREDGQNVKAKRLRRDNRKRPLGHFMAVRVERVFRDIPLRGA